MLGAVEAVQFVEEEDGACAAAFQDGAGVGQQVAHFLDAGRHGVQRPKATLRLLRDDVRQRGLAGAGRAVEDQRAEPIGLQHAPQQLAFAEEMLLPDKLLERARPHPRRQRLRLLPIRFVNALEQVDGSPPTLRSDREPRPMASTRAVGISRAMPSLYPRDILEMSSERNVMCTEVKSAHKRRNNHATHSDPCDGCVCASGGATPDENRGGPGATKEAQKLPQEVREPRTFVLEAPPDLHLVPGQRRDVTISVESGIDFHQRVSLYFGMPEGVRVVPAHAEIQAGDKQTTITIMADRQAIIGDRTLQIMGEPETGAAVLMKVPVHVDPPE